MVQHSQQKDKTMTQINIISNDKKTANNIKSEIEATAEWDKWQHDITVTVNPSATSQVKITSCDALVAALILCKKHNNDNEMVVMVKPIHREDDDFIGLYQEDFDVDCFDMVEFHRSVMESYEDYEVIELWCTER